MKPSGKFHLPSLGLMPLFILAHFVHHLLNALPIPLLPMIRSDFNLDYTRSGLIISAFNLSYGIGQVPAGWLTDRIGARLMMALGICGVAIAGFLVGISQTYIMLVVFLALMGIMGGGYHPGSTEVISSLEPSQRGRALGLHMIGGSASFFLSPLIAAAIAGIWGWRGSFITLAVPTIIFGVVFYWLMSQGSASKAVAFHMQQPEATHVPGRWHRLITIMVMAAFIQSVVFATISFIPLFLVDHFSMSKEAAAALIALIYAPGLWSSPFGGYLSDRLGRMPVIIAAFIILVPLIFLLTLVPGGIAVSILLVAIGAVMYLYPPVCQAYIVENAPSRHRSTVMGMYFFGTMEGGGVMSPVMGYFIDHLGFQASFSFGAIAMLAATLIGVTFLWFNRTQPQHRIKIHV